MHGSRELSGTVTATWPHGQAFAQSSNLPPVTVDAPKPRAAPASEQTLRGASAKLGGCEEERSELPEQAQLLDQLASTSDAPCKMSGEDRIRAVPINGYVAERTLTGTKTNTPIMRTLQAISVVGQEEIRDQNPQNLAAAPPDAAGCAPLKRSAPTRAMTGSISCGFDAQDVGLFQDGLQLSSFAFATWKFPPWGIQRIDIALAASAVLYGGSGRGGIVNVISKSSSVRAGQDGPRRPSIHSATAIFCSTPAAR